LDFGSYGLALSYHRFNLIKQAGSIVRIDIVLKSTDGKKVIPTDVLMNILNPSDFTPFLYQDIYDETVMALAFDELNEWFMRYKADIERLVIDPVAVEALLEAVKEDMAVYFSKQLEQKQDIYDYYLNYKTFRFSFSNYQLFLLGDYKKCLAAYRRFNKQGRFPAYDQRMIKLMEVRSSIEGYRPKVLVDPLIENNYRYFRVLGIHAYQKQSVISYFTAVAVMLIPSSALAYAIMGILTVIVSAGTLFASKPTWDLGIILGIIGAFGFGLMIWPMMHGRLYRKDHERYLNLKALAMSETDRKMLRIFAAFGFLFFLFFASMASLDQVTLRDKTFTMDNFFIDLTLLKSYEYDQIERVEYRSTIMEYGEERPFENYTIMMKDGKEMHLFSTVSIETIETKIVPIFIEKNVTVIPRQP